MRSIVAALVVSILCVNQLAAQRLPEPLPTVPEFSDSTTFSVAPIVLSWHRQARCANPLGQAVLGGLFGFGVGLGFLVVTNWDGYSSEAERNQARVFVLSTAALGSVVFVWRNARRCRAIEPGA